MSGGKTQFSIAVLGAKGVDKTELALQLCLDTSAADYIPSIQDKFEKKMTVDGVEYQLNVIDAAGRDETQGIGDIGIKDADAHLIVYSVISQASFDEVDKYREMVQTLGPAPPKIVLVANKCEEKDRSITEAQGREKAARWGCPFFETSSRDNINVYAAFEAALKLLLGKKVAKGRQSGKAGGGDGCNVA
jgi:small GTP-binding protein